jgi:hypothetical protein
MATFILQDATGIGSDDLDPAQGFIDMTIIANDTGLGIDDPAASMQRITYARTVNGPPQQRLDTMVNTAFSPDYGGGPANVDSIVIAGLHGLVLDDGTPMANNGTALAPKSSGLPGSGLNPTENCLIIYDTKLTICVARDGSGGELDLPVSPPVALYHEFSHAFRIVNNTLLGLTGTCDPSSPEERAAIIDENDLRTDLANRSGDSATLRDPGNHCGKVESECESCCIIATLVSKSASSPQVQWLRCARDHFVRGTEVGHAFFEKFFRDYYAFSPQACTIMAGDRAIPQHLLEGYIEPLLDFWKLMIERGKRALSSAQIGAALIALHTDRMHAERRHAALQRTAGYWLHQTAGTATASADAPAQLIALLRERAWPSPYIQWALVAPVGIYHALLTQYLDGVDAAALGRAFEGALDTWVPEVPISEVWAALPAEQVRRELAFCERALLQTPRSRARFRQRLGERFPDITAVARVLGRSQMTEKGEAWRATTASPMT